MKRTLALVAVAGAAALAQGQTTAMSVNLQAWDTSDSTWKDLVEVAPGAVVQMRMVATWSTQTGNGIAWGGAAFGAINLTNSTAGDAVSLSWTDKVNPASQTFKIYNGGLATDKIDRADNQAQSMQFAQLSTNFGGSTDNPILLSTFNYNTDAGDLNTRDVLLNLALATDFSLANIFTTAGGSSISVAPANRSFDGATIRITPAPGSIALLGLGGLVAGRRRRA